jgi:hypothetical protein
MASNLPSTSTASNDDSYPTDIRAIMGPGRGLDYHQTIVKLLLRMESSGRIDQSLLRVFIGLAPSYLLLDCTTQGGTAKWSLGFHRVVDVMIALHERGELEFDTVNEASKACSEVWSISGEFLFAFYFLGYSSANDVHVWGFYSHVAG